MHRQIANSPFPLTCMQIVQSKSAAVPNLAPVGWRPLGIISKVSDQPTPQAPASGGRGLVRNCGQFGNSIPSRSACSRAKPSRPSLTQWRPAGRAAPADKGAPGVRLVAGLDRPTDQPTSQRASQPASQPTSLACTLFPCGMGQLLNLVPGRCLG